MRFTIVFLGHRRQGGHLEPYTTTVSTASHVMAHTRKHRHVMVARSRFPKQARRQAGRADLHGEGAHARVCVCGV